ncbi:MAG: proprotein convertase P-domain-containing protein [Persicimonas sp.]
MRLSTRLSFLALAGLLVLSGCGDDQAQANNENGQQQTSDSPPLTPIDELFDGERPDNADLPAQGKADAVYPDEFSDLLELQTPVKSQGSRGVCSIFSNVALMEHLYIKEGTLENPDFSEQYLQWSVKNEVGAFRNTAGSSSRNNLQAISQYGIVEESAWRYEPNPWGASDDEDCEGDSMPTKCYTNGEPPEEALDAEKWTLPRGEWVSTRPDDIKAVMHEKGMAVVVGLDFFYQSWNHGASDLPTNSEYSNNGYVLYPNDTDKQKSRENRAGHSILLVGWDDDLEVPRMDAEGNEMVDENGETITEKGFFIFKNSWGTGFGADNPHGAGYGFISMDYVEEYGTAYMSDVPELEVPEEICGDGEDNDGNGDVDCEDAACADHAFCNEESDTAEYSSDETVDIPDNDDEGASTTIEVDREGAIASLAATVDITHTYRGDLTVWLESPTGDFAALVEEDGSSEDDIQETFVVTDFDGEEASGTWTLYVWDGAELDTGTLNGWSLEIGY